MYYTICIKTPYNTYYLENYKKIDVVDFKDSLSTFLSADYGFFSLEYLDEEILLGYETIMKSEIKIYKQYED